MWKWALAAALGFVPVGAHAATYSFDFSTTDSTSAVTGSITTADTLDAAGGYDVLSISATIFGSGFGPAGGAIALEPNPSQPSPASIPFFAYDNVYFPGASTPVDPYGLLFSAGGYNYNLYLNGLTAYLSTDNPAGGYNPGSEVVFGDPGLRADAVANAPEPSTWALMLLGFAGLGLVVRRQARARNTVSQAI
jgi:hypothetical protein